ncbi:unnamed protein product, partial [Mesorhabditis belari]|uniref:Serpentine receptor class gamma n=1 Tax=Mesorhabditis belari TaxID=2138241 RepID=A0AAF3FQ36_9BILA
MINIPFFIITGRATNTPMRSQILMLANSQALMMSLIETMVFVICSTVVCAIGFGYSLVLSSKSEKVSQVEHRLLISSIFQALPMFLELIRLLIHVTLVVILKDTSAIATVSEVAYYYLDLTCTIQPWCLLATNANIRRLLIPARDSKSDDSNSSVVSVNASVPMKRTSNL